MKRYLKLIKLFSKYSLIHATIYKVDFLIWSLVDVGWFALSIFFYQILFANVNVVAGWTKAEILLLQGVFFIMTSILWGIFWNNFNQLPKKINDGTLDFDLIKPIDSQFMISFQHLDLDHANSFFLGLFTILYAVNLGHMSIKLINIIQAAIFILLGAILFYSLYFITMSMAFWFDRIENLPWLFPSVRDFMKLPQSFYQGSLRLLFVYIFPIILVTSIPTQILLGIPSLNYIFVLVPAAFISLAISRWFFHYAIKHYSSASS